MLAAVLCVAALGHLVLGESPQVTTSYGTMKGQVLKSRDGRDYFSFTRIPYAKPPVGERRFLNFRYLGYTITRKNEIEENIKVRLKVGNAFLYGCETWPLTIRDEQRLKVFENKVLRRIFGPKKDESTGEFWRLHNAELRERYPVNIIEEIKLRRIKWANKIAEISNERIPKKLIFAVPTGEARVTGRLPVIFYIHGGGFIIGSAADLGSAKSFMDEDVVLVTINYRLGTMGFLSLEDNTLRGNMGLKDQALALEWVHQEISAFGGDPNLITVAGGSAGAASTHFLCEVPRTNGERTVS
ncbi:unnamed protein product [Nezara viridula]|uniref:Carboxylic ester hydrolase n=1 Tax=Nezara viridula TaxID=85310 RepID=A0A9P0HSF0_NEZVI|nr:unnamed protein product [Nezara viridula]